MRLYLFVLCALFLPSEVGAARRVTQGRRTSAECPEETIINTKGDCAEAGTNRLVDQSCCDRIRTCHSKLDRLLAVYDERLSMYMTECGLLAQDVEMSSKGKYDTNASAVVRDDTRICAATCQKTEKLIATIEAVSISVLQKECGDSTSLELISYMAPVVTLVTTLDTTWRACDADDGDPQPLCPDSSMVTHDCGYMGITQHECEERGCCWDVPPRDRWGRPWCYKARGSVECEKKCPDWYHPREKREDCSAFLILDRFRDPDPKVRQVACEEVGCCWQPLEHGSADAWCFYKPCI